MVLLQIPIDGLGRYHIRIFRDMTSAKKYLDKLEADGNARKGWNLNDSLDTAIIAEMSLNGEGMYVDPTRPQYSCIEHYFNEGYI